MRQPKCGKEFVHSSAPSPSIRIAALGSPTIGPFAAALKALSGSAGAPAQSPRVVDKRPESLGDAGTGLTGKRNTNLVSGHDAGH
jgi:hypothetical protein